MGRSNLCWFMEPITELGVGKLATILNSTGHNVTALDLAASGISPIKVEQLHSFSEYVEPLITLLGSLAPKERVILLGHSSDGVVISFAMERFPEKIAVAVYASAAMRGPSLSYLTVAAKVPKVFIMTEQDPSSTDLQLLMITKNPPDEVKREKIWGGKHEKTNLLMDKV
ncbi:hypothetical protein ACLB2K_008224 [Fragaria x ananassa]